MPSIADTSFAGAAGLAAARASDVRQNEVTVAADARELEADLAARGGERGEGEKIGLVERADAGFAEPGGNAHRHAADAERFAEPGG